jgi:hypothetical protein
MSAPERERDSLHGQRRLMVTAGEHTIKCAATRGRRCRLRLSGAGVEGVGPTVAWASGRRNSDGNDGQDGESRTLGDGRIPWVLVDNKSAAEVGKRCLLLIGGQRLRVVSVR